MIEIIKNLDFEKLKDKVMPLAIAGACFVAVFIAGFGTGRISNGGVSNSPAKRSLTNSTTNTGDKTKSAAGGATAGASAGAGNNAATGGAQNSNTTAAAKPTPAGAVDPNNCYIKGSKSKTYHMPGGSFYDRTNPAACFNSEEEAVAAGYKKSSR